ncbi:hypothetical protein SAMN02746066_04575 [Anaerosporobacter mobilis DSM 15930]|jgi:5-methylcytosine-specific restriction endonuclease McrA|uniref:HNH endonuclease n=1 Tax=Anaerosporobacter mobilis DSM 15930 TaxID=1120996 RepID=A0A1M7NLF7_9FIRM|nr:hypothetical protein [Anaerosporobacter mobilis]SHN04305.1 hypothetical protein SAMN02746066_04575 [Anaerosporobacter mobilis DSM 15930]
MIYRLCTVCGSKVPQYELCQCEHKKRLDNYRDYQRRRIENEEEKERVDFYHSDEWERCRNTVAAHQFNLDLIEWSKGNIVQADLYHHVIEVRDSKEDRLDIYNIIGVTQANHNKVHAYMNRGQREKKKMQDALMDILDRFETEYY